MTGYEAMEHAQTVCTRLFSVKKPGYEASDSCSRNGSLVVS